MCGNMSKNSFCAKEMKTRAENKIKKFFWFIVYCLLFIVYGLWSMVYSLLFMECSGENKGTAISKLKTTQLFNYFTEN